MPRTLVKAIKIIEAIASNQPVEVKRLSKLVKVPLPTAYRFISMLEENGYVARSAENGKYRLGLAFVKLGAMALRPFHLSEFARPILREIAASTGESVSLQIRRGSEAICIDYVESEHSIRLSQRIGQVTPLYVGSGPKLLLAYATEEERESLIRAMPLKKIGPKTITSKVELRRRLQEIRQRGYDVSEEEMTEGARGVAVPIFGSAGHVVAALSVSGLKYRMGKDAIAKALKILKGASKRLSGQLPLESVSLIR